MIFKPAPSGTPREGRTRDEFFESCDGDPLLTWRQNHGRSKSAARPQHVKGDTMSYSSPAGAYRIDIADQIGTAFRTALDNLMLVVEMALLPFVIIVGIELAGRLALGVAPAAILAAL